MLNEYEINEQLYKSKETFLQNQTGTMKKVLSKGKEYERRLKFHNLNFNPEHYKYKEIVPTIILDKYYLLEEEYKKNSIPYSPFLLCRPGQDEKEEENGKNNFSFYKRHILLETYDEEPEPEGAITKRIVNAKQKSEKETIKGYTKWLEYDEHIWKECELISYDEKEKLFNISIKFDNVKKQQSEVKKKVTRFNFLFEGDSLEDLNKRIALAKRWKFYAKKYIAFFHFVSSFKLTDVFNPVDESFMERIFYLAFLYKSTSKPQLTPLQFESLDHSARFGIWRRHARKRQIEIDKKRLAKSLANIPSRTIEAIQEEIKDLNMRTYQMIEFYKLLPRNYQMFVLLNEIIPKEKFLLPCEKYLHPQNQHGTIIFERRKPFLKMFRKMEKILHQSERDSTLLLDSVHKKFADELNNKIFFYRNWLVKPIKIQDFKIKNKENIHVIIKEINFIIGHASYEIINYLKERIKQAKKVNKGANIPPQIINKFRSFQNLLNRKVGTYGRDNFHRSMEYMTDIWRNINRKVLGDDILKDDDLQSADQLTLSIEDILSIRDDYNLEHHFEVSFDDLQFCFEMKYEKSQFAVEPSFSTWWAMIEGMIRSNVLTPLSNISAINVFDLLTPEEQNNFYVASEAKVCVFFSDDLSYEEEIAKLKHEVARFFSLIDRFLQLLNGEVKTGLSELLQFSKDIKTNNINEESLNIEHFRYFIKQVKYYLTFFTETFKYDDFFLGGILINVKSTREYWINRLSDIKDQLFKLIIENNVFLSKELENLKEKIEAKLEEEPGSVDEYDSQVKYCENLNNEMKGIWERINNQQMNAELLEENFFLLKREDFFRMWQCYGIPRHLHMKKQETVSKLTNDRKKFKKELKQRYINTITDISKIRNDFETMTIVNEIENFDETFRFFSSHKFRIEKMIKQCSVLNEHQMIIGIKSTDLSEIKEIYNLFIDYYYLWEAVYQFMSGKKIWMDDPLKKIDRKGLKITYDNCISTIDRLEKSVFKREKPAPNKVIVLLRERIKEFQPFLPLLYDLINPDFKPNLIADLSKAIGVPIPEDLNINLTELISRGIMQKREEIADRSSYATGQKKLNSSLDKVKEKYKMLKVDVVFFKSTDLLVLKDVEILNDEIDELLTKVVAMSSSKFAKYLIKEINNIWNNLAKAQEIIDVWMKVQKMMTQMHQIFVYGDLKKQLVDEFQKYESIDKQWRLIMEQVRNSPQIIEVIQIQKLKEILTKSLSGLEEIVKSLIAYLNTKRDIFPRFYFVSNEELTMMLAQSGDPGIIAENYIQQVFEGIKRLDTSVEEETKDEEIMLKLPEEDIHGDSNDRVSVIKHKAFSAMISEQGEKVLFNNQIKPYETTIIYGEELTKNLMLERWLSDLEKEMQNTLKTLFVASLVDLLNEKPREEWAEEHIEQAILSISQLNWTTRTTKAIIDCRDDPNSLKALLENENKSLTKLIYKMRKGNMSNLLKRTLVSLIIQDVHSNDVLKYLIDCDITSASSFEWVSQLRYYLINVKGKETSNINEIAGISVRMLNTERNYDFEYLGNQKRLVITPLTDRCYRTMMEALNNSLGGAPEGPAGTGKTETIKDLSRNLGKKCFTYNCSEDSDYTLMTKFFRGIAMSGCWVCFDEFNRISLDVLSVIAHQISILLTALKARTPTCIFDGATIPFNFNMGIFITMNPDYAGRSELPDNLKGLFRPLAMMIPDYAMITEIMLYSFGFNQARSLSRKIVSSLRLASEQLSSQQHYDYGMRALTAIINYIGNLSGQNKENDEEHLVQKAIRDSNMPKFIADDYKIYEGILMDLFPNDHFQNHTNEEFSISITENCNKLNLINCDYLKEKVVDFNNVMSVRHAVMIVGSAMSNKSSIIKIFQNATKDLYLKTNQNRSVKSHTINPKSITSNQLFGYVNKKTLEFSEGVCSKALREYFSDNSNDLKLLIFDGPVDTMWIENMNSVLDDTKKLCLENSDQIRLDEKTFIIFEVDDLSQASLATISRCGMVYTDRSNIDPFAYFYSWLKTLPLSYSENNYTELIKAAFEAYYIPIMDHFLFDEYGVFKFKASLPIYKNWLMKNFICLLESLIFNQLTKDEIKENEVEVLKHKNEASDPDVLTIDENKNKVSPDTPRKTVTKQERSELLNKFIYAMMINFTTVLDLNKEQKYVVEKIFEFNKNLINSHSFLLKEELLNFSKSYMSVGKDFLDFIYNPQSNSFANINEVIRSDQHEHNQNELKSFLTSGGNIMIPSSSTSKANFMIQLCNHSLVPVILYGSTASGKSLLMKDYLSKSTKTNWINTTFILNSKTSANNICDLIEEKISYKLKKNTVAPQNNKHCLILIEDLNMPSKEKYGAQPAIEILRQFFDYGGWHDRKEKEFLYLKNILMYSCLTIGRPLVSGRLLWHFLPIQMNEIDEGTMRNIYSQYFNAKFFDYSQGVRKLQETFVDVVINAYNLVRGLFRPLPATPHYAFNLRDLTKVFEGVAMIPSDVVSLRVDQSEYMSMLLLHEMTRVFYDRLGNESDRGKYKSQIFSDIQMRLFKRNPNSSFQEHFSIDTIMFTEINEDFTYKKVDDVALLKDEIYKMLEDYNFNKKFKERLELILFDYSLKHLLRADRILSKNNEHGVLVGLTGSGRQSLCCLAAFIKKFKVFRTRTSDEVDEYGHKEWLKDIQELFLNTGIKKEATMFLIKDTNITDERMYVDLNCIISSGSVYNLFSNEEKVELIANIKQIKEYEDVSLSDDQAYWEAFLSKSMQRCRVMLCVNPLSPNFTKNLRNFPALVNNTSIDWYEPWPESALYFLGQREVGKELESTTLVDDVASIFSKIFMRLNEKNEEYFTQTRKKVIILPKSYLDFLNFFGTFYQKYNNKTDKDILKYKEGVDKIEEAGRQIKSMGDFLEIKRPQLVEQSIMMEITMKEIEIQKIQTEEFQRQCEENEKIALDRREEAEVKQKIASFNMQEAEILKGEIYKKIMLIDAKQFMALRSYRIPPKEITKMMGAISVIMSNFEKKPLEVVPKEWEFYKKKLNDVKLLKVLESLPKKLETTLFSDKILKLLEPLVHDPDLDPNYMEKKISSTCACFCYFIKNMFLLDDILKNKIFPSTKASDEAQKLFMDAQESVDTQKRNLVEVTSKLSLLNEDFNRRNFEKQQLELEITEGQKKMQRAQRLTSKLSGEKKRWFETIEDLEKKRVYIFGDLIVSAVYISFLGPYLNQFREVFLKETLFPLLEEKNILFSHLHAVNKLIGNANKTQDWIINGLPPDSGSIDNGVVLFETKRPCLLIDPQKQAMKFLSKMFKNDLVIYKQADSSNYNYNYNKESQLETCIKTGKTLIFDYVSYDVVQEAESLLNSEEVVTQSVRYLRINQGADIPLHPKFRYFLISYNPNPEFNPELYGKISIINFTVTHSGLTEQLLSLIVKEESPGDETEKLNILQRKFQLTETLIKQEEEILERLSVSSETLLDNDSLIVNLEDCKRFADEASMQIQNAKLTEDRIDLNRMMYLPLANLGTMIYFIISDLVYVENIYQFSIGWYTKDVLVQSIKLSGEKPLKTNQQVVEKRVTMLSQNLIKQAYQVVSRSLLNKDKILFAFLILLRKLEANGSIKEEEIEFLLKETIRSNSDSHSINPFDYIEQSKWERLQQLNKIHSYSGIIEEIIGNPVQWKSFITLDILNNPFDFPSLKLNSLNKFKKLLFNKIFNFEGLIPCIQSIISDEFDKELTAQNLFTINQLLENSSCHTPMMLIMTPGIDPTNDVKKIAEENNKELMSISLGQGQTSKALENIEFCQRKGLWVFLQNLHLVPEFMKNLEQVINSLQSSDKEVNTQFRMWLSALPNGNILPSILINSSKLTLESPSGVKSNLTKLIKSQERIWQYDHENMKRIGIDYEFTRLFVGLMHFHSILLERKNYGPIGWNIKYNFNDSDFLISKNILKGNLEKFSGANEHIPFKAIIYLTADCIYGGRVTDDWDRRTLFSLLNDFYNKNVLDDDNFCLNNVKEYTIPYLETSEAYFQKIEELSSVETPEVLGLHPNTLIRKQMEESNELIFSLMLMDKEDIHSSGGLNRSNILNGIVEQVNRKLIRNFNVNEIKKSFPLRHDDCMNSILIQEIMRYNSLLKLIFSTLEDAVNAYLGHLPMTDEIENLTNQIVNNRTPTQWTQASYPSRKPLGSWINDLEGKLAFFNQWITNGTPKSFLISAFYFTQSFLAGIKQNYARKYKVSIDKLDFNFTFESSENSLDTSNGYLIYGLFIEGAEWRQETKCIDELSGRKVTSEMPSILITICTHEGEEKPTEGYIYK